MLVLIMCFSVVPMTDLGIEVSATSKTVDEALAWVRSQQNKSLDVDGYPDWQPYQCVDLIALYYSYLGVPRSSGNGCDYATNTLPDGWSRIPKGVPQPGDILVYTGNDSDHKAGHVAIYEASNAIWHQNWGYNYVIKTTNITYNSLSSYLTYWGYIRPNFSSGSSTPADTVDPVIIGTYIGSPGDPENYFRVCYEASDNVGVTSVRVATWTKDDQADLVWRDCNHNGSGTWFMDIKYSDYDSNACEIFNRFYVYDAAGNRAIENCHLVFDNEPPVVSNVRVTAIAENGYEITCTVSDNVGVSKVMFPSWTTNNGQDDIVWHEGTLSGNTAKCWIGIERHNNEYGEYSTHIYAYDSRENRSNSQTIKVIVPSINSNVEGIASGTYDISKTQTIGVWGWAYNRNGSVVDGYYQIDDNDMVMFEKIDRNDVVRNHTDCRQVNCGYAKDIDITNLSAGTHAIKIIISSNGMSKIVASSTITITGCSHGTTEIRNAKSATCTATGYTGDTYCKTCGAKTKTGTTISKTSHNSNTTIPAVDATCTSTGLTEGKKCSVCGTVTVAQQTVAKKSHSYTATVTTQPTCTKDGVRTYKCSCGTTYTEAIAKTGHNSNTTIPAVAATCTKTGLTEGKKCSVCGTVTLAQQTIAAKGHTDGNGDYKCDYNCGYEYEKPAEPEVPSDPSENCSCNCHKGGIAGFFFRIINFFQKLFGMNKVCECGAKH